MTHPIDTASPEYADLQAEQERLLDQIDALDLRLLDIRQRMTSIEIAEHTADYYAEAM